MASASSCLKTNDGLAQNSSLLTARKKIGRMKITLKTFLIALLTFAMGVSAAQAAETLNVYGPGGPAPAMKEAAIAFSAARGISVNVTAGPTPQWANQAKADADVIFSGAENMMSDFSKVMPGVFDLARAEPVYLRPVSLLVRPGNPKRIQNFRDVLKPGIKVLTVAGAGQVGLWEDVAGRTGDIEMLKAFRGNMVPEAANSAEAKAQWARQTDIDAWLIWNIWQVANPDLAQVVAVEPDLRIYRDMGLVVTNRANGNADAMAFINFIKSNTGRQIFMKWGWQ